MPLDAAPIRFGSWMGGDRDGNPNVTAAVTEEVCLLARWQAADLYLREVERLHDELSMTRASAELASRVGNAAEPYRALLKEVLARLHATRETCESGLRVLHGKAPQPVPRRGDHRPPGAADRTAPPYTDPHELWGPLALCYRSLQETGGGRHRRRAAAGRAAPAGGAGAVAVASWTSARSPRSTPGRWTPSPARWGWAATSPGRRRNGWRS